MKKLSSLFLGVCFLIWNGVIASDVQFGGVQPLDATIPNFSPNVENIINKWINTGLTNFSGKTFSPISDKDLFANINNNKAALAPNQEGMFAPNWNAIVDAIQRGDFNGLHFMRMLISEYLVGRMVIAASPLKSSVLFRNDSTSATMIQQFFNNGTTKLQQLRYARNAFTTPFISQLTSSNNVSTGSTSGWGNPNAGTSSTPDSYSNSLSALDTFAGLIIVNNTDYRFGDANRSIPSKTNGFFPVQEAADKWQMTPVAGKWGKRRKIDFNVENNNATGSVSVYQETGKDLPSIYFGDPSTVSETPFDNSLMSAFFQDAAHPWTVVVNVENTGGSIIGLAKLNTMDFPNALSFSKTSTAVVGATNVSLANLWNIPMELYNATIANVNEDAGQGYPLAAWMLQALFNGYLQTSFYKAVVPASMGSIDWKGKWQTPVFEDWFRDPSPLNWKFLRMLIVTYAANELMYINNSSMKKISQILQNPKESISDIWYVGSTNNYVPVVPVIPVVPVVPVKS